MKNRPSSSPSTTSPGITVALPMRTGILIPVSITLFSESGAGAAIVGRHAGRNQLAEPEHAAVHHHAGAGGLPDVVGELVADERSAIRLAEQVDHNHIVRAEHVDHGLVAQPPDAALGRFVLHAFGDIGPQGHELHGEGASNQPLPGMQDLPVAGELVRKALRLHRAMGFMRSDPFLGTLSRPPSDLVGQRALPVGERPSSRLIMAMISTKQRQHIKPAREGAAAKQRPQ